ncbi:MAG: hypothetical protein R3Y54_07935 [Eubacteriales bacterium]
MKYNNSRKMLVFAFITIVVMFSISIALFYYQNETDIEDIGYTLPQDAQVILHLSTRTDTNVNFSPDPLSLIYYYDSDGHILGMVEKKEEVMRDFIIKGNDTVAFLFKNNTILSNEKGHKNIEVNSKIFIEADNFGPSQTGYLEEYDMFYSLLNVGQKEGEEYINVVRFVSDMKSYDVIVPYHLENIAYDSIENEIICIVSDLNDINNPNTIKYIVLEFNDRLTEFSMNETLHTVDYDKTGYYSDKDIMFRTTMANNNYLYSVYIADTEKFVQDNNNDYFRTHGNLILTIVDREKETAENLFLKDNYDLGELGYGLLTGSDHLPMEVIDDTLYVFTSDYEVYIIKSEDDVKKIEIPYEFKGSLSLKRPFSKEYNDLENFFGSEIKVINDTIYVLTLFPNNTLKLYTLSDNAKYEMLWQGQLPSTSRKDLFVNTFEILF